MRPADDDAIRLALFLEWKEKCAHCRMPLTYGQMQIDHLVPQDTDPQDLPTVCRQLGLPSDFDVQGVSNLVPACGRCNRMKSNTALRPTPIVQILLDMAAKRANAASIRANHFRSETKVDQLLARLRAIDATLLSGDKRDTLLAEAERLAKQLKVSTKSLVGVRHDYIPPEVTHVDRQSVEWTELFVALQEFDGISEAVDEWFTVPGQQRLRSASIRDLEEAVYSSQHGEYVVRGHYSINYDHYDEEGFPSEADAYDTLDHWLRVEDDHRGRIRVVEMMADFAGVIG